MKLNLGAGFTRFDGFVNIDDDPLTNPDYIVNLDDVNIKLPFEDNTIEEIKAYHILEHIGDGFIPLLKELYRVCKHGAIFDILVPHHFHDVFYGDPTHKRPITVSGMALFDQSRNKVDQEKFSSSSGLGIKYGIDFQMVWYDFDYDDFYISMINSIMQSREKGEISERENWMFERMMREGNNIAVHTKIKMVAVKE